WHATYGLPPTFSTWAQLTFLHLHVLQLRIRQFPAGHSRAWTQQLLDHFFYGAEEKMASVHKLEMRGVRAKYLKDLFEQWRGAEISYDEGIVKGDAVLAAAVWRNLFQGREDTDVVKVAEVVGWMRRAARGLAGLSDAEFASGRWKF
ncbi:ubiquinol-cytochrome C chaperone, partial [Myriangium duriaei CBS 260.36]